MDFEPLLPKQEIKTAARAWTIQLTKLARTICQRRFFVFSVFFCLIVWYIHVSCDLNNFSRRVFSYVEDERPSGYLVWTKYCKIQNFDVFASDAMKHIQFKNYEMCHPSMPVYTDVVFDDSDRTYKIFVRSNNGEHVNCCFQETIRGYNGSQADSDVSYGNCTNITNGTEIPTDMESIFVKCKLNAKIYNYGYPLVQEKSEVRQRIDEWTENSSIRPINVLFIGIDSLSRMNFHRAMPRTAGYLMENGWYEMFGYNKMADNTFPNLMAVLTGYDENKARNICEPEKVGKLSNCPFIWDTFKSCGYATAYGEDETWMSTFNYLKVGFEVPPVDYYLHPFVIGAVEKLEKTSLEDLDFCLGHKHAAEYVYDYGMDFIRRYGRDPFFGFFWTNSFSHNAADTPTTMDERMRLYFQQLDATGVLKSTVVFFLSDHGMRWGPIRESKSGYHEERMPALFVSLPEVLQREYPDMFYNLRLNQHRLISPFDLHMTLKHILKLSGRVPPSELAQSEGCSLCQSIFDPVPSNRSCEDVGVSPHWCSCAPQEDMNITSVAVANLAKYSVEYINRYIQTFQNGNFSQHCVVYSLGEVHEAERITVSEGHLNQTMFRVVFSTEPNKGLFEATVYNNTRRDLAANMPSAVSRLSLYRDESDCVDDSTLRKYCLCQNRVKVGSGYGAT